MKTALNVIIALLIFLIWSDIENNSVSNNPNYNDSIIYLGILLIFGFLRIYVTDFKKELMTKK